MEVKSGDTLATWLQRFPVLEWAARELRFGCAMSHAEGDVIDQSWPYQLSSFGTQVLEEVSQLLYMSLQQPAMRQRCSNFACWQLMLLTRPIHGSTVARSESWLVVRVLAAKVLFECPCEFADIADIVNPKLCAVAAIIDVATQGDGNMRPLMSLVISFLMQMIDESKDSQKKIHAFLAAIITVHQSCVFEKTYNEPGYVTFGEFDSLRLNQYRSCCRSLLGNSHSQDLNSAWSWVSDVLLKNQCAG